MRISVIGCGYVGLANALLLAQYDKVLAYDISKEKIDKLSKKESTLNDPEISNFLAKKRMKLDFTSDFSEMVEFGELFIIATPTDYKEEEGQFDTSSIEAVIAPTLKVRPDALFLIKSTIPVNYVKKLKAHFQTENIIYSPEFLREGKALYDNLYPSRIIIGEESERAEKIAVMYRKAAAERKVPVLLMNEAEAESIKLFSNAYLASRIAFFNELDTYAEINGLDSKKIIDGIGFDSRIGDYYNNPSFGYGGYCLPKDTKQVEAEFQELPHEMMTAIVNSNQARKEFIAEQILSRNPETVGIYRLAMKANSDNSRYSAILDIIEYLQQADVKIVIFEPTLSCCEFQGVEVEENFGMFCDEVDLIVANRMDDSLYCVEDKVYTRDLFVRD